MTLLLTPARIAAIDVPIIGPDGRAGNDGSPFGARAHAPMSGQGSAAVAASLSDFQAYESGSPLELRPVVAGGTAGRGGSGTLGTVQSGGNDGSGGWVTLSLAHLSVGTAAAPFKSGVEVILVATGGFAGGAGTATGPAGSAGRSADDDGPYRSATNAGNGGDGGNGGGASAALNGVTATMDYPLTTLSQHGHSNDYWLAAVGQDGTAGGNGGRAGDGGLHDHAAALTGSGGRGGTGGRGIAAVNGTTLSYQRSVGAETRFHVDATGGDGANGGAGGDASLVGLVGGSETVYGAGGDGGAGGAGGRAAAVFSQNAIKSTSGLHVTIELSASAGAGGHGGVGGAGAGAGSTTPGMPGLAGQAGANGQAIVAINANHLQLGVGSWLGLGILASNDGVGQPLNTPGGPVLQFNGNVFQTAGNSTLNLADVVGGSAVVDVGAGTLTIAGSAINRIGGFDSLVGTALGGDRFVDGPGVQQYHLGSRQYNAETVAFHPGHGADTVDLLFSNGERPQSFGTIKLDGFGAPFGTFPQVLAAAVDTGADTRIATPDGGSILVVGYHAADLVAGDFHFG